MTQSYRLTRIADEDLTNIWIHSRNNWGAAQADRYLSELETCFLELSNHPQMGRERPEIKHGYRSLPKNQHIIFYRQRPQGGIEIIRVLHQRMEVAPSLEHM